jgi:hypothetical protein
VAWGIQIEGLEIEHGENKRKAGKSMKDCIRQSRITKGHYTTDSTKPNTLFLTDV